jgi:thioester reductase-like protein
LVDFALESWNKPSIFFISSVGVVKDQKSNEAVPEELIDDFTRAEGGYGSSKLVAEWVLAKANAQSGLECSICRLGQIAGPVDVPFGMWNKQEWLPSVSNGVNQNWKIANDNIDNCKFEIHGQSSVRLVFIRPGRVASCQHNVEDNTRTCWSC